MKKTTEIKSTRSAFHDTHPRRALVKQKATTDLSTLIDKSSYLFFYLEAKRLVPEAKELIEQATEDAINSLKI